MTDFATRKAEGREDPEQKNLIAIFHPKEEDDVLIEGRCLFVFSKPEHDGWGFGRIEIQQSGQNAVVGVTGHVGSELYQGAPVRINGFWINHGHYGWQVKIRALEVNLDTSLDGVAAWFEARFPDIGPVRSRALVLTFGDQIWDVVENHPERLTEADGIGEVLADSVHRTFVAFKQEKEAWVYLAGLGIGPELIRRAVDRWGSSTRKTVEANPYELLALPTAMFPIVDRIAKKAGVKANDERRVVAGFVYAMRNLERDGHTCASAVRIQAAAASRDCLSVSLKVVQQHWPIAVSSGALIGEFGVFSRKELADAEHSIADRIGLLLMALPRSVK